MMAGRLIPKHTLHGLAGWVLAAGLLTGGPLHADVPPAEPIPESSSVVVKLFGAGAGNLDSYGSGILISEQGHIITVWNHLINTGYLTAVIADGRRFQVDVIGTSAGHDLAVLQLRTDSDEPFPSIDRQAAVRPLPGTAVHAFSNMFHVATGNEPVSVVHGIIAADTPLEAGFGRWTLPLKSSVLIVDAVTNNSGAAGGLLTTREGAPAGMLGRELRHAESGTWVNYAVPFDTLNPVIDTILSGNTVAQDSTDSAAEPISRRRLTADWGITLLPEVLQETPAYVDRVIPDSAADKAGLRRGDLVVLVDDDVIQTSRDLRVSLGNIRSGLRVTITVNRRGALEPVQMRAP